MSTTLEATEEEAFFKHYENIVKQATPKGPYGEVTWVDGSSAVYLALDHTPLGVALPSVEPTSPNFFATPNYFTSTAGVANGAEKTYYAKQLHFHTESEHTIDGKRFDFEMHIVHQGIGMPLDSGSTTNPYGKVGVLGIMFDTKDYDTSVSDAAVEAIDKYFDSLAFDKMADLPAYAGGDTPTLYPEEVALGELMSVINTNDRWVYKGSLTTPGCLEGLYWNFVKTVYPIKPHHMAAYRSAMYKHGTHSKTASSLFEKGNWRKERPAGAEHNLKLFKGKPAPKVEVTKDDVDSAANASLAMIILLCIAMFIALSLTVYACVLHDKLNTPTYKVEGDKVDIGIVPEGDAAVDNGAKAE